MGSSNMFKYDPQKAGPQYLEDLATAYWWSETLFNAVEMDIFTFLEPQGKDIQEIVAKLNCPRPGLERFLHALGVLGLVNVHQQVYYNTPLSSRYLVRGQGDYQGDSVLWRQYLVDYWRDLGSSMAKGGAVHYAADEEDSKSLTRRIRKYIKAMDSIARTKVKEMLPFFTGLPLRGKLLDVGAGSGAVTAGFLEAFPGLWATLLDIPEVLDYTRELMQKRVIRERVVYCPANILEKWTTGKDEFDLVILSNIVHAYAEKEITHILQEAASVLKPNGFLVIHDFFLGHRPTKAALFDLNMFINTYNGKVFDEKWILQNLKAQNLFTTELIPLKTDTALIIASKSEQVLQQVKLENASRLAVSFRALGFSNVYPIAAKMVQVTDWADQRCRFGCSSYGSPHCPPNTTTPEKTRKMLADYTQAFLLEGEPPTGVFQRLVLKAEKLAFKAGFYKAFAYWAGPCSICTTCTTDGICKRTAEARPSMEGSGIDVFETVKRAGISLKTLDARDEFVKYFGLLLLE